MKISIIALWSSLVHAVGCSQVISVATIEKLVLQDNLAGLRFLAVGNTILNVRINGQPLLIYAVAKAASDGMIKMLAQHSFAHIDSALITAIKSNQPSMVALLLELGANPNYKGSQGITPLHLACQEGHLEIFKLLIKTGTMSICQTDHRRFNTPLHLACSQGHVNIVKILLPLGALINLVNVDGFTPLHLAVINGQSEVVKVLLAKGAVPNFCPPLTPLYFLQHFTNISWLEFLSTRQLGSHLSEEEQEYLCRLTVSVNQHGELVDRRVAIPFLHPRVYNMLYEDDRNVLQRLFEFKRNLDKLLPFEVFAYNIIECFSFFTEHVKSLHTCHGVKTKVLLQTVLVDFLAYLRADRYKSTRNVSQFEAIFNIVLEQAPEISTVAVSRVVDMFDDLLCQNIIDLVIEQINIEYMP